MHVELPIRIYMFNIRIPITLEVEELVLVKQSFRAKRRISGMPVKYRSVTMSSFRNLTRRLFWVQKQCPHLECP